MPDVRMPDGRIVKNVPDGTTKAQLLAKLEAYDAQQSATQQPAQELRSFGEQLGRQAGLTARAAAQGIASVPALFSDALIVNPVNAVSDAMGSDSRLPKAREAVGGALDAAGVAQPENATERVVQDIGTVGTSAMTGIGLANSIAAAPGVAGSVANVLQGDRGVQALGSFLGPLASGTARENGASPAVQTGLGLAGSLVPGVAQMGLHEGVRRAYRGGEAGRRVVEQNIDDFQRAGTTPTVGQATQGRIAQATESLLAKTPGSAGVIANKASGMADDLAVGMNARAAQLSPNSDPTRAGAAIERGITGAGGFIETNTARAGRLFGAVDNAMPADTPIPLTRTMQVLDELAAPVPGAPNSSARLINNELAGLRDDFAKDLAASQNGGIPYKAVSALRSMIGRRLGAFNLVDDIPIAELNRVYGAMSDDIMQGAQAAGNTQAVEALNRANRFYRNYMGRIEQLQRVVNKNGGPEAVYNAAISGTKDGATTVRRVMQSIPPQARRDFVAAVVGKLGRATSGQQNATTDAFSINTYLTNFSNLSPRARSALFARMPAGFAEDMDAVARVADNIRQGSKVFSNPPGTSSAITAQTVTGTVIGGILTGKWLQAGAVMAGVAGANMTARLMVNPRFVRFLARSTRVPAGMTNAAIANLANQAKESKDEDLTIAAKQLGEYYKQYQGNKQ